MPTFPKYRGELPQCLNPLNLRHYWLLAYWVYFRPTALHCYLYQAAPECYQLRGLSKVRRTLGISAYRNLYLMGIPAVLLFALLLGLGVALYLLGTLQFQPVRSWDVEVATNGQLVVCAPVDNTIKVWDLKSGKLLHNLQGHTDQVLDVKVIPDGQLAISSSEDNTVKVWDLKSGKLLHNLQGHTDQVRDVKLSREGQLARVWDLKSGKLLYTFHVDIGDGFIWVSPDGLLATSTLRKDTLRIWDMKSWKLLYVLQIRTTEGKFGILTPDGQLQLSISASDNNNLEVWHRKSGTLLHTLSHSDDIEDVAITSDGQLVVSASEDNTLGVWDLKSGELLHILQDHTADVEAVVVTPDGQLAVSASNDGTFRVWDLKKGAAVPLGETKSRLISRLTMTILWGVAAINIPLVFAILYALSTVIFGQFCSWVIGLFFSLIFSVILSELTLLTFYTLFTNAGFNVLGEPFVFLFNYANSLTLLFSKIELNLYAFVYYSTDISNAIFALLFGIFYCIIIGRNRYKIFNAIGTTIALIFIVLFPLINERIDVINSIVDYWLAERDDKEIITGAIRDITQYSLWFMRDITLFFLFVQLGSLRIIFYPVQLIVALCNYFHNWRHPAEWDELGILPLPGTQRIISQCLHWDETQGLELASEIGRNFFRRSAVQKALKDYLHNKNQVAPVHLLYKLININTYIAAPASKQDWEQMPTMGYLLLGELDCKRVNYNINWANRFSESLLWYCTQLRYDRRKTPLTYFAGMLYRLLDEKTVNAEDFDLGSDRPIYARLTDYPGGVEIERSFDAMTSFLSYKELSALPTAVNAVAELPPEETAIRPTVLKVLNRLRDIALEVATYLAATSRVNKQSALLRATDALKTQDEYVTAEVVPPEQTILRRIIRQWSDLIIKEGGEVGRDQIIEPVANPYVVGNPVTNHLFVGREDIMRRLEELWMVTGQCPSVVIYGHRRMGKSSILRNLGASLGSQTTVVDFNMQRVGLVDSTEELLYNFALSIYDVLPVALQGQLGEPNEERFCTHNPFTALDRFLKQLDSVRAEQRFIITIDEFELIEQLIEQKRLEPRLLDFWRGLIQTYPWFVLAFAGLHTLQEMTQNYWNPLFGSVTAIPVSFLSPKAAERLITQPSPDFNLDYDTETITEIIQLTNGQPYLVQLVGHTLVTRFNRQMFEERIERDRRFTLEDVNAVINTPEFYRDGNAYFNGVWVQAENSEPPGQTAILEALCQAGLSITEIAEKTGLSCDRIQSALLTLQRHDVIKQQNEQYVYTVELMRRWVAQRTSVQQ